MIGTMTAIRYAAVENHIVKAVGRKDAMLRIIRSNGGVKNGWDLWFTAQPVGGYIK